MEKKCDVHAGSEKQEALDVTAHSGWALQCSSEYQKEVGVCLRDTVKHLTAWTRNSHGLLGKKQACPTQHWIILTCNLCCGQEATLRTDVDRQHSFLQTEVSDPGTFYLPELCVSST